jgi:hypothetical protein
MTTISNGVVVVPSSLVAADVQVVVVGPAITSITGVSWEQADAGKVPGKYGDVDVHYPGRDQYAQNKRATGRKRDLADLEALGEN